jgi:prevent-host-death family protein
MTEVASRELRNHLRAVLDRVAAGESITITVDGRPVARLEPTDSRPQWISRERFLRGLGAHQADPGLKADLRRLLGDETTDDISLR